MPLPNLIHIDQALTNLSLAYTNDELIAPKVLPQVTVNKLTNKYFVYGREHFRYTEARVEPKALAGEFDYTLSTQSFQAQHRALRHLIPYQNEWNEDVPLNEQVDVTELITEKLALIMEVDVATYVTSNSNLTNYTALSGGSQWSDYVNSTPLTNIKTAKTSVRQNSFKRANTMVIPYDTALTLADHPSIKDLIKYTDPKSLSDTGLPPVIRGLRIIEAGAYQDSSVEGETFSPANAWGKNVIVAFINPGYGLRKISLGYIFMAPDSQTGTVGISTRRYVDEPRKGEWVECEMTYDYRIVAPGCGYLYQTVTA